MIRTTLIFALAVTSFGCAATPSTPPDQAAGRHDDKLNYIVPDAPLSEADAQALEAMLTDKDDNLKTRIDLLWHYRNQFGDNDANARANSHLLWMITHHPDAKVLGTPIAQVQTLPGDATVEAFSSLWIAKAAAAPRNARVQGHAGLFFKATDPERALRLLELAHALDTAEPLWLENLGDLYAKRAAGQSVYPKWLAKAVESYRGALALLHSDRSKVNLLPKLAGVQLKSMMIDDAERSAAQLEKLLEEDTSDSSDEAVSRHTLHVIRGLIAVQRAVTPVAERELAQAADAIKDHSVSLWQLDMSLADQLQKQNRWLPVLHYLDAVLKATKDQAVAGWLTSLKRKERADLDSFRH